MSINREGLINRYINRNRETWYDRFLKMIVDANEDIKDQKQLTDLLSKCVAKRKEYLFQRLRFGMTGKDKSCAKRFLVIKLLKREITIQDLKDYLKDKNA